jgi:hypothetical protein
LRMHVSISAMGSVIIFVVVRGPLSIVRCCVSASGSVATNNGRRTTDDLLPTRVADARNHSLVGQIAEANATNTKLLVHGARAATQFAAVLAASAEFWRPFRFGNFRFAGHFGWVL